MRIIFGRGYAEYFPACFWDFIDNEVIELLKSPIFYVKVKSPFGKRLLKNEEEIK